MRSSSSQRSQSRETRTDMLDVLSPQKGDTPRGGVGSPRRGRFGQTTLTQTTSVLATLFAAGCLVGLALSTDSSVPTHTAHALSAGSAEVDKSVSLLMLLNLDHYAPLVKRRRMSFDSLAKGDPEKVPQGFLPGDWRALVQEAHHRSLLITELREHAATSPAVPSQTTPDSPPPPPPSGTTTPENAASTEEEIVDTTAGSQAVEEGTDVFEEGSDSAASTQVTIPPIRTIQPEICESTHRTEVLRSQYYAHIGTPRPKYNLSKIVEQVPYACKRYHNQIEGDPAEAASLPVKSHGAKWGLSSEDLASPLPVTSAAKGGRWLKQQITYEGLQGLKKKGVLDQFYVDHELKLMYCVVPKAGCTSFKAWLLNNAGLFTGKSVHDRNLYSGERVQHASVLADETLLDILNNGDYFKFSFTRSPYTRALATYLERFLDCTKRRSSDECRRWRLSLMSGKDTFPEDATFKQYLKAIRDTPAPSITFMNAHWLPALRICGYDELGYDFVGRLENSADHKLLYSMTGKAKPQSKEKDLRHSEGTTAKMAAYYDKEAVSLCQETYAATDEVLLGYVADDLRDSLG